MTQLAIKGHSTRGKEVIEILEMLGGKNSSEYSGNCIETHYYIATNEIYNTRISPINKNIFMCFTLEKFLEKFPYKVGDKVTVTGLPEYPKIINFMEWFNGDIHYSFDDETWFLPSELNLYKEETTETITIDDFKANTKEWLIDKLHDMVISKAIKTIGDLHEELHKPQYPKTYVECARMLDCFGATYIDGYKGELLDKFQELLICRDAYWKMAGEQMGLGKPWEPKHEYDEEIFFIYCDRVNGINKGQGFPTDNFCLSFPTKEMRDEFYENFKELIEICKEFL